MAKLKRVKVIIRDEEFNLTPRQLINKLSKLDHWDYEDFFENNKGDIIVSNPPFTLVPRVLERLVELGKPFILIMPSPKICTQYMRKLFSKTEDPIQIMIPRKRIQFVKLVNGEVPEDYKSKCNFDCFYYCYKMNLPNDIVWLE